MDSHTAIRRNELLLQATTWMNLTDIILSESVQPQKNSNTENSMLFISVYMKFKNLRYDVKSQDCGRWENILIGKVQ